MQIVETTNEGLKRAYTLTIPAKAIADRIDGELKRMAPQAKMPGFRPGKVPANLLKKMHGPALHQEALNGSIREAVDSLISDKQLRPATQPQVNLGAGYEEGKDAELTVDVEVLPVIATPDLSGLKLEKLVVPVADAQVDEAVMRIASSAKRFEDAPEGKAAENGDQVVVDFLGKLDGVPFEGGEAQDAALELGAGRFIPGFEEQLVGVKLGDETVINVTFPEDYPAENLKGKAVTFDITVKAVKVEAIENPKFWRSAIFLPSVRCGAPRRGTARPAGGDRGAGPGRPLAGGAGVRPRAHRLRAHPSVRGFHPGGEPQEAQ